MPDERRQRLWHFRDLFTDHKTGKLRETLLWSNVGKGILAWAFIYNVINKSDTEFLTLVFIACIIFHELASRLISQFAPAFIEKRFGIQPDKTVST